MERNSAVRELGFMTDIIKPLGDSNSRTRDQCTYVTPVSEGDLVEKI